MMDFNHIYERDVPSMSKALNLKNGKVSLDTPLKTSRSLLKGNDI